MNRKNRAATTHSVRELAELARAEMDRAVARFPGFRLPEEWQKRIKEAFEKFRDGLTMDIQELNDLISEELRGLVRLQRAFVKNSTAKDFFMTGLESRERRTGIKLDEDLTQRTRKYANALGEITRVDPIDLDKASEAYVACQRIMDEVFDEMSKRIESRRQREKAKREEEELKRKEKLVAEREAQRQRELARRQSDGDAALETLFGAPVADSEAARLNEQLATTQPELADDPGYIRTDNFGVDDVLDSLEDGEQAG